MEKKCVFILPYFGEFKNYFPLFLESCSYNVNYDWIIFTDSKISYNYPKNVKKIQMTFEEMKNIIQDKFDFEISLERPYKLCDYRPAYGYIFENQIKEYDYWGYCDCDLIFGSLDHFLPDILNAGYDKVFAGGHCTLYKNSYENNRRFMNTSREHGELYKQAFTSAQGHAFDEMSYSINIHTLFLEDTANVFEKDLAFNVSTDSYMFRRKPFDPKTKRWIEEFQNKYIVFDKGHVYASPMNKSWDLSEEYLYAHFQGRKFCIDQSKKLLDAKVIFMPGKIFMYDGYPNVLTLLKWNLRYFSIVRLKEYCRKVKRKYFNPQFDPLVFCPYKEDVPTCEK